MDSWGFRFVNALSIALFCVSGVAWAGATCYPAGPPRVITDWNDANNWAESADGVPGTCAATGGRSTAFRYASGEPLWRMVRMMPDSGTGEDFRNSFECDRRWQRSSV